MLEELHTEGGGKCLDRILPCSVVVMAAAAANDDDFSPSLQMDVIVADLDGGSIRVPESLTVSLLPDPFWSQTHAALSKVCQNFLGVFP